MIPRFRASKVFSKMRERHRGTRGNSFIRFDILTRMQTHRDRSMYLHSVCVLTIRRKGENDRAEWGEWLYPSFRSASRTLGIFFILESIDSSPFQTLIPFS